MGMEIGDNIGNGNGKEWETTCMGMGMALIPMEINSHQQMQCKAYVLLRKRQLSRPLPLCIFSVVCDVQ